MPSAGGEAKKELAALGAVKLDLGQYARTEDACKTLDGHIGKLTTFFQKLGAYHLLFSACVLILKKGVV